MDNLIYLDQNIIQYDYEGLLQLKPIDDYTYVYSDEHFNEINRKEDERFFDVLRRIKARKIKLVLDKKFKITNQIVLLDYSDPRSLYDSYIETIGDLKKHSELFYKIQPFLMGNKEAIVPETIGVTFLKNQQELINSIDCIPDDIMKQLSGLMTLIGDGLQETLKKAESEILPLEKLRKQISKKNLSELEIKDGTIIDNIWEEIKDCFPGVDKDELFGKNAFLPNDNNSMFESVVKCHNILNTIGYYPDKGLSKESKVYGINSDASHLGHSIFCSALLSADDHLCKKANAIFEYLNLKTVIMQLSFKTHS